MKTKKSKLINAFLLLAISTATFTGAMANDERYLDSDPININGYVAEEIAPTDGELENVKQELKKTKAAIVINKEKKKSYNNLSKSTEKLGEEVVEMIEERQEYTKVAAENKKKIDCLMSEGEKEGCEKYVKSKKEDVVSTVQAAPAPVVAPVVETKVVEASDDSFGSTIKVLPYIGLSTIMTEYENLEAGVSAGLKVESNVNSRLSVGVGFAYSSLTTTDFGGDQYIQDPNYRNAYDSYYGGREIEYKNMNLGLYSKFYLLKNERFRPYVGAGLGYNRTTLKYKNNNSAGSSASYGYGYNYNGFYNNATFGNEEVTTSNFNAELMVGSEIIFTKTIGMNIEFNYQRALGGNISTKNGLDVYNAPDQQRLEDLSSQIGDANIVSLFAGLLVQF